MLVFPKFATGGEMVLFSPIVETAWENINGEVSGIFVSVKKGIVPAADAFVPAAAFSGRVSGDLSPVRSPPGRNVGVAAVSCTVFSSLAKMSSSVSTHSSMG